jgi:hypothetical protein
MISGTGNWEAQLDHIFFCAHSWNAILLMDEADVVLEARSVGGRTQNTWASGLISLYASHVTSLTTTSCSISSKVRILQRYLDLDN